MTRERRHDRPPWWIRIADLAALLLVALAVLAFVTGGVRLTIAGLPLSVTRPAHLLAEASVIALLRALAWRRAGATGDTLLLAAFAGLVLSLAGDSGPRRVGDGGEYMAMARGLAHLSGPAIRPEDIEYFSQKPWGSIEGHRAEDQSLRGADRRQDFIHFWFYPMLAAPFVGAAEAAGVHPNWGFTALNLLLVLGTVTVLIRRLDAATVLVLFCGPLLWWIDKAHTEVFTFAMLSFGFALLRDKPWWSLAALGAASTQNPPIGAALGLALAWLVLTGRWRDRRAQLGAFAGVALAILPPLYYHSRLGVWFPLGGAAAPHVPGIAAFTAVLWDPNLGMLLFAPCWTLAVVLSAAVVIARQPARLLNPELCLAGVTAAWFLLSFSQAINVNSGGTFGPSRYGLWLLPLAAPLFLQLVEWRGRDRTRWMRVAAMLAVLWVPIVAQPRFNENSLEPSRLASWLWTRWPSLDNPLPEVFTERVARREGDLVLPIATPSCEKALLVATEARGVLWPPQCVPRPAPPACAAPGTLCYANRGGTSYTFSVAPSQPWFRYAYRVAEPGGR